MNSFATISDIPTMNTPEEFVQELIKMKANVRIYDFMLELKARFYPNVNMILYEDFSQYVGRDHEFCIDARMYYKYSKLLVPGYEFDLKTCDPRSNILRVLDCSKMEKGANYRLLIEEEPVAQGGFVKSNRYMMSPESFYRLLMDIPDRYRQARQTFCEYHSFQTKVIKYYDNFQIGLAKLIDEEKQKMLAMKDDKIDNLEKKIDKQSEEMIKQNHKIDQLLQFGNKLVGQNEDLQLTMDMTREELSESLDHLAKKSFKSTIDPIDVEKITHFAVLAPINGNRTILVRGQRKQVMKKIAQHSETHSPVIEITYNANSINLIENAKKKFMKIRKEYLSKYNAQARLENTMLKRKIDKFNRRNRYSTITQRQFELEKQDLLLVANIPIKFMNTYFDYDENDHFSYNDIIQIIADMNEQTQKSPI